MAYIIDLEKLQLKIDMPDEQIVANIIYYVPENSRIVPLSGNDQFCIYWSNQTARYYAVPRKILYQGD